MLLNAGHHIDLGFAELTGSAPVGHARRGSVGDEVLQVCGTALACDICGQRFTGGTLTQYAVAAGTTLKNIFFGCSISASVRAISGSTPGAVTKSASIPEERLRSGFLFPPAAFRCACLNYFLCTEKAATSSTSWSFSWAAMGVIGFFRSPALKAVSCLIRYSSFCPARLGYSGLRLCPLGPWQPKQSAARFPRSGSPAA